jgi:hypothetical protein
LNRHIASPALHTDIFIFIDIPQDSLSGADIDNQSTLPVIRQLGSPKPSTSAKSGRYRGVSECHDFVDDPENGIQTDESSDDGAMRHELIQPETLGKLTEFSVYIYS